MVLGLKFGQDDEEDKYSKTMNYLLVKDFVSRFRKLNGAINCKELIMPSFSAKSYAPKSARVEIITSLPWQASNV